MFFNDDNFGFKNLSKLDIFMSIMFFVFYAFLIILYKNNIFLTDNVFIIGSLVLTTLSSSIFRLFLYNKKERL
jgi:hypothetical protein